MVSCVVVDDDPTILSVFCELLTMLSVDVLSTAQNGYDAVKKYEQFKPDVIFLDLIMPEYDGFYAIEKIIQHDPDAKIIIVTGYLEQSESELLNTFPVTEIIYKPFDINQIKNAITNALL